jgi:hypothetical protein
MKKILKRYGFFSILLAVNIAVGIIWPKIGLKSLDLSISNLLEMLSSFLRSSYSWAFSTYGSTARP